jgi:urease gamma subunit
MIVFIALVALLVVMHMHRVAKQRELQAIRLDHLAQVARIAQAAAREAQAQAAVDAAEAELAHAQARLVTEEPELFEGGQ